MNWDTWLEFLQMGGYALHVWGSYLVLPALVLIELVLLLLRKREIFGHLGWKRDEAKHT
jgi:heme exporter protein CcmD